MKGKVWCWAGHALISVFSTGAFPSACGITGMGWGKGGGRGKRGEKIASIPLLLVGLNIGSEESDTRTTELDLALK